MSIVALGLRLDRAEEIAQRAWTRIVEKHGRGELETLVLPGLVLAQARFLALDELRTLEKERRRRVSVADVTLRDAAADPERRALAKDELERALAAVGGCTPAQQRLFRAVYEGPHRPHKEIAADLGISTQRVRQTLCELRRTLRAALEEDER